MFQLISLVLRLCFAYNDGEDNKTPPKKLVGLPMPNSFYFSLIASFAVVCCFFAPDQVRGQNGHAVTFTPGASFELTVSGSGAQDFIEVRQLISGHLRVLINGTDFGVFDRPNKIRVLAGNGNDEIRFQANVDVDATVDAGGGDDIVRTGAGDDQVSGGYGDDIIFMRAGDDQYAGPGSFFTFGNDVIRGQAGNDTIYGVKGDNYIVGGSGDDLLVGGTGNDVIFGLGGKDSIVVDSGLGFGESGEYFMSGGDGDDFIRGGDQNDTLIGGNGNDIIQAGRGEDFLSGGNGDDDLWGDLGSDTLIGGAGQDLLKGEGQNDVLVGGDGNDTLDGGHGDDSLNGGPDIDVAINFGELLHLNIEVDVWQ